MPIDIGKGCPMPDTIYFDKTKIVLYAILLVGRMKNVIIQPF